MKIKERFKVVEFTNPSGGTAYRVTGTKHTGERVRQNYKTKEEADTAAADLEHEFTDAEKTVRPRFTRLTDDQCKVAERAFADLESASHAKPEFLLKAVRYFIDTYHEPVKCMALPKAYDQFLLAKRVENCRPDTIRNLKTRVGLLVANNGQKNVSDIQPADIEAVTGDVQFTPRTRKNRRLALSAFFNWCVDKGYCATNPTAKVAAPKTDVEAPEVLPLSDVRSLLHHAAEFKRGKLLPYVVLSTFCFIRPAELFRVVSWDDIDLEGKHVAIKSKGRGRRPVDIPDNAVKWLLPYAVKKPKLKPENFNKDWTALRKLAGYGVGDKLKLWPEDALRHTGISNHLALHQDENKTALQAGNSPDVIHKYYKGLVKQSDAKEFFAIRADKKKIVKLKRAA